MKYFFIFFLFSFYYLQAGICGSKTKVEVITGEAEAQERKNKADREALEIEKTKLQFKREKAVLNNLTDELEETIRRRSKHRRMSTDMIDAMLKKPDVIPGSDGESVKLEAGDFFMTAVDLLDTLERQDSGDLKKFRDELRKDREDIARETETLPFPLVGETEAPSLRRKSSAHLKKVLAKNELSNTDAADIIDSYIVIREDEKKLEEDALKLQADRESFVTIVVAAKEAEDYADF